MKTTLISLATATLLGIAARVSGHSFDAGDFIAILFTTGLVAWTMTQYDRPPRNLNRPRPIRLPIGLVEREPDQEPVRLAA